MPQINLLSPTSGKKIRKAREETAAISSTAKPFFVNYYLIGLVVILMIITRVIMGTKITKYNHELANLEKKEAGLTIDPQKLIKLNDYKKIVLKKLDFLEKLTEKRFLWSQKLDRIVELIPDGVWLTEFSSEKKINFDPISKQSTGEQPVVSIKGRAVALKIQDAIELVGIFIDRLKNDNIFSNDFVEIKLSSVTKGIIANRDIMNFEFDCVIK